MDKALKPITTIGKVLRNLTNKIPFIRKRRMRKAQMDQSIIMLAIGIVILITVGFMGWVYSYMYSVQKEYDEANPGTEVIYQKSE